MNRLYRVYKENIQWPHLLVLAGICFFIHFGFQWLDHQTYQRNKELVQKTYCVPDLKGPKTNLRCTALYDNLLKVSQNDVQAKRVDQFLNQNGDIKELVSPHFRFHGMMELMTYLMWKNSYDEELRCFRFLVDKSIDTLAISPAAKNVNFYDAMARIYFGDLFISPIRDEWQTGNFYEMKKMATQLKQRFDVFRFSNDEDLPSPIRDINERIVLIALAAQYADVYATHHESSGKIFQGVFGLDEDSVTNDNNYFSSMPAELKPLTFYLRGIRQMRKENFSEALRLFSNVHQYNVKGSLSEYTYFMTSRCLFELLKQNPSPDKLTRFMNESEWSCLKHIKNKNLIAELRNYQEKAATFVSPQKRI